MVSSRGPAAFRKVSWFSCVILIDDSRHNPASRSFTFIYPSSPAYWEVPKFPKFAGDLPRTWPIAIGPGWRWRKPIDAGCLRGLKVRPGIRIQKQLVHMIMANRTYHIYAIYPSVRCWRQETWDDCNLKAQNPTLLRLSALSDELK